MDLQTWKEQAARRLRGLGNWVQEHQGQLAPYALYGTLCGMSLWPLVEAAQAGELLPAMMALGSVAGGVGGNLIAGQVQRWKDRAGNEAAAGEWVAAEAPRNDELRAALDAILERLDAVAQAQAGLGEAERRWFTETLRGELAHLGNLSRFEASLEGSGAIAQGAGAMATGQGGVIVRGDVGGDVVTGIQRTAFDQRGQKVRRQVNVAGDWRGPAPDGDDEEPPAGG